MSEHEEQTTSGLIPVVRGGIVSRSASLVRRGLALLELRRQPTEDERITQCRKAADQGDAEAQYSLGIAYAEGRGVPQDSAEALKWLREAADQGLGLAQCVLGHCYQEGWHSPKEDRCRFPHPA